VEGRPGGSRGAAQISAAPLGPATSAPWVAKFCTADRALTTAPPSAARALGKHLVVSRSGTSPALLEVSGVCCTHTRSNGERRQRLHAFYLFNPFERNLVRRNGTYSINRRAVRRTFRESTLRDGRNSLRVARSAPASSLPWVFGAGCRQLRAAGTESGGTWPQLHSGQTREHKADDDVLYDGRAVKPAPLGSIARKNFASAPRIACEARNLPVFSITKVAVSSGLGARRADPPRSPRREPGRPSELLGRVKRARRLAGRGVGALGSRAARPLLARPRLVDA